jgi:hypothetical protein
MLKKTLIEAAVTLSTVGGALLGVGLSRDAVIKVIALPEWLFTGSILLGLLLPLLGAAAFALSVAVGHIRSVVAQVTYGDVDIFAAQPVNRTCLHCTSYTLATLVAMFRLGR